MTQAHQREAWNHTAAVLAMLANIHRDPKKSRAVAPEDLHPMGKQRRQAAPEPVEKADIALLKTVFVDQRPLDTGR